MNYGEVLCGLEAEAGLAPSSSFLFFGNTKVNLIFLPILRQFPILASDELFYKHPRVILVGYTCLNVPVFD